MTRQGAGRRVAGIVGLVAVGVLPLAAQAPPIDEGGRPLVRAVLLEPGEVIELDGRLEEAVWRRSAPAERFTQQEPTEGADSTERTEVRVAYDRDRLYIGAMLFDRDPDGIIGHQKQRDEGLGSDDRFMWILDTFLDGRTGYFFEINPAGLMGDGLLQVGSGRRVNKSWDGIWEARVVKGGGGWSAEIRIPFRTLNFDPSLDTWGINFQRTVRRKQEEVLWSGHRRNQGIFRPTHAGRLVGLEGLSQGLGLEAKPYAAAGWKKDLEAGTQTPSDIGVDLTYSVTPSLRAAVTVNTDFAETEVDQRRVNLTRFPLFFPERRDFFLEGSGVYQFAPSSRVNPYFSRRIGLVEGEAIPVTYGARLGGQAGAYEIGLLQIRTGEHRSTDLAQPVEDFTVARVKRAFFTQSTLGVIYTRRGTTGLDDVEAPPDRHTLGADLNLLTSTFLGDKNLQFEAFYVWHTDPVREGTTSVMDRSARGLRLSYPNDRWRLNASYRELGEEWDPAVGFTSRRGFRRFQPSLSFQPRPARFEQIRQLEFEARLEYLTNLENELETREIDFTPLGIEFQSGDELQLRTASHFERLDEPFEIDTDVVIPPGDYSFLDWSVSVETARQRRVWGEAELTRGQFWSGDRTQYELSLTVKPYPGVSVAAEWEHDDVSLSEGAFSTNLVRFVGDWHLSPWSTVTGNLQYDNVSDIAGLYTRLRWILRPGNDLYVVYTHNWQYDARRFFTLSRGATTKLNYTHRF